MIADEESSEDDDAIFEKAKEFIKIVQYTSFNADHSSITSVERSTFPNSKHKTMINFGVERKNKRSNESIKSETISAAKRKKLERVKIPVTSLRPVSKDEDCFGDINNHDSVNKMFEHFGTLPKQEKYTPLEKPPMDTDISPYNISSKTEYTYLSGERDLSTWELLKSSPKNCNVFVGNLSYKINEEVLKTIFQTFVIEEQKRTDMKVRLVTDIQTGVSKGYGFINFPYRRAAELAFICMKGFQIFDREIQLGWGQESNTENTQKKPTRIGSVISDSSKVEVSCQKKKKTRWDVENQTMNQIPTQNPASITWLTKEQRVEMVCVKAEIRNVCKNLRQCGIKHHLGLFDIHFEADNSRMFFTCSKTLTSEELQKAFKKYGEMHLDCLKDATGNFKGCGFVHYKTMEAASNALKHLHGEKLSGKIIKLKVAEPKTFLDR